MMPMDHIRKIVQLSGNPTWQVNLRKYGLGRPQFETKEAAEAALADAIKKRGAGLNPSLRNITFAEQAEAFLKHAADGLAEKTMRSYRGHLENHVLPQFGKRRVSEINTPMIKSFLTAKRQPIPTVKIVSANPKKSRVIDAADFDAATMKLWPEQDAGASRKLSSTTVRLIRASASVVFASAVDDRIIDRNPVTDARASRRSRKARAANNIAVPKERPFSRLQQDALLSWCSKRDPELYDFIFTMLRLGTRPGEARALRWSDIVGRKILVERSATDKNEITETKTGGKRAVDMSPALWDVLRLRQLKRVATGTDYIFGNGVTPLSVRDLGKRFELALGECAITGHVMYDCRHTFASVLLQRCRDVVYTAKMLGHADPATTLRYYAHFLESTSSAYVDLLDATENEIGSDLAVAAHHGPPASENAA
jgi:integrase